MLNKYIIKNHIDLANPILGSKVISCTDQFFAPATRILKSSPPIFKENVFDKHGKWMDGWETRRKRSRGNDYLIIKLGKPGKIKYVDINTAFFNGNQPEYAKIEGCFSKTSKLKSINWVKITNKNKVKPNCSNIFQSKSTKTFNYIRLNIYPDGGIARIKLFGDIDLSLQKNTKKSHIDLASIFNGSQIIACSDEHFGNVNNILLPGKSKNMGNGWETRRKRKKGNDWALIKLGKRGFIYSFEINTHFFKGNYPDSFSIQATNNLKNLSIKSLIKDSKNWKILIKKTKLKPNSTFKVKLIQNSNLKFNFIKLNIYPDGGISRFRVFGKMADK